MNKLFVGVLAWLLLPGITLAAPTRFESSNYGVESVIFGFGVALRSAAFSIPPEITTDPAVSSITTSSFTVSWGTDKVTNAIVRYGLVSGVYTDEVGSFSDYSSATHQVQIRNLAKGTPYFLKVRSQDVAGNVVESAEVRVTTDPGDVTAPVITVGPVITADSASTVSVYWETNEVSNSVVEYGTSAVDEQSVGRFEELTLQHRVQVTGLTPQRQYLLRVKSRDAALNQVVSATQNLTSPSAPGVSNVRISNITLDSALIEWDTSLPTDSVLRYGVTPELGQEKQEASPTQNHIARLTGLVNGSTYYVQLSGSDAAGNVVTSDQYVFKTVTQPNIIGFTVSAVAQSTATLTWSSSSELDELVRGEITNSYDTSLIGKQITAGSEKSSLTHELILSDLESDTTYCVVARGKDAFGNSAISPQECFTTQKDAIPPIVQGVKIIANTDPGSKGVQVLVSFGTSEPTRALVEYGEGAAGPYTDTALVNGDGTTLTTSHLAILSGLNPGSTYHFRIIVTDRAGNTNPEKQEYLVPTESKKLSLLDLIAARVSDNFGWLSKIGGN